MKADDKLFGIMPVIGLGTWEMTGSGCVRSVASALSLGYRHLDTAQLYGNEKEVGKGIGQSGVSREEIFVTTKVATFNLTPAGIKRTVPESLEKLGTDYVDLLLIHWPTRSMILEECLETMFGLKENGLVRNVGVSNFDPGLFTKAIGIGPVLTNQVKFTPYDKEFANLAVAKERDKIITAYSPLARGGIVNDRILGKIGSKYGKSASQVTLRWLIQLGNVSVIPKASGERHQQENIDVFDFELSTEEMESIKKIRKGFLWS
jgi:diketogulonate reductase-like aldo/keto reductase